MKTDVGGRSTCQNGQEHYEVFYDKLLRIYRIQYDYRTDGGRLFSCITGSVQDARRRRDEWLEEGG